MSPVAMPTPACGSEDPPITPPSLPEVVRPDRPTYNRRTTTDGSFPTDLTANGRPVRTTLVAGPRSRCPP